MYKASTYFIKAQMPALTMLQVQQYFADELKSQGITKIEQEENRLSFKIDPLQSIYTSRNRFSKFSEGTIDFTETDTSFLIKLDANILNLFIIPSVLTGLFLTILLLGAKFDVTLLFIAAALFIVLTIVNFITMAISFPVYLTTLRNRLENDYAASNNG